MLHIMSFTFVAVVNLYVASLYVANYMSHFYTQYLKNEITAYFVVLKFQDIVL